MCRWLPLRSLRMLWLPKGPSGYSSGCPWAPWVFYGCLWSPWLSQRLPLNHLSMLWLPLVPLVIPVVAPEPSESAMVASGPTGYSSGCPWAIWECNGCLWSPCLFQWLPLSHLRVQWLTLVPLVLPACCPCVRARECVRGILNAGWLTANLRICWSLLNHLSCPSWLYSWINRRCSVILPPHHGYIPWINRRCSVILPAHHGYIPWINRRCSVIIPAHHGYIPWINRRCYNILEGNTVYGREGYVHNRRECVS